jgi:uncharacterized protein (TIGR03086 family)
MDLVDLYARSLEGFVALVRRVEPNQWEAPSPCDGWTVRELVNHVVNEDRWTPPMFDGATVAEVGDRFDGDLLGPDPVGNAATAAAQARAAVAAPDALGRTVHLSFGDTPAREYVYQLFADHLVHGWDLAAAIGADRRLDGDLVRACAEWFGEREHVYRQAGVISSRVEVAGDDPQDRLIGAFGRRPDWSAG